MPILIDKSTLNIRLKIYIEHPNDKSTLNIFSVYASQTGHPREEKSFFFDQLLCEIFSVPYKKILLVCGDFNY